MRHEQPLKRGCFCLLHPYKCSRATGDEASAMPELTVPQAAEQGRVLCLDKEEEGEEIRRSTRNFL